MLRLQDPELSDDDIFSVNLSQIGTNRQHFEGETQTGKQRLRNLL